jgi:hypothetical protein
MPLPTHITWYQAEPGVEYFEIRDETSHLVYSIPLIDCHAEVLARPPSEQETLERLGSIPSSYCLKRNTWIQEHLLDLYVNAIQGGISNEGYFYGIFSEVGAWREIDSVRLNSRSVYIIRGELHRSLQIGLLYSPTSITTTVNEVSLTKIGLLSLPTSMLELMEDRETFDRLTKPRSEPTPEPLIERRSRYDRPPVI